jgi:hypothetical protein
MNDQLLRDTFAAHEHLGPDAELAFDGIRRRIRTRRRSRAAVAGAVATVAAIAVGSAVLASSGGHRATPGIPPVSRSVSALPHQPASPTEVTFKPGWLPAGSVETSTTNESGQQFRVYGASIGGTTVRLTISLGHGPMQLKGGVHDFSLGGHPAREVGDGGAYLLDVTEPGGQLMQVQLIAIRKSGDAAALAAAGRHVASEIRFGRHDPIKHRYSLSYIPAALAISCMNWNGPYPGTGTSCTLARPGARVCGGGGIFIHEERVPWTMYKQQAANWGAGMSHRPGRAVQGHPTYVSSRGNNAQLWIDGALPDASIALDADGYGLADLYKIADGLILPH